MRTGRGAANAANRVWKSNVWRVFPRLRRSHWMHERKVLLAASTRQQWPRGPSSGHGSCVDFSKSGGAAVLAAIRSRNQRAGRLVSPDNLAAAERNHRAADPVAATRQLGLDNGRNRLLEVQHIIMAETAR